MILCWIDGTLDFNAANIDQIDVAGIQELIQLFKACKIEIEESKRLALIVNFEGKCRELVGKVEKIVTRGDDKPSAKKSLAKQVEVENPDKMAEEELPSPVEELTTAMPEEEMILEEEPTTAKKAGRKPSKKAPKKSAKKSTAKDQSESLIPEPILQEEVNTIITTPTL